jgi:hypothetical protein
MAVLTVLWCLAVFGLVGCSVWLGWEVAHERLADRSEYLAARAVEVDQQWQALQRAQQVNQAFWEARVAMRNEAMTRLDNARPPRG